MRVQQPKQEDTNRHNTKAALVRAAERLFAEKGLGTVSVKEITKAAGARNPSAVHYHFGSIECLIKEVFAQRFRQVEEKRVKRLAKVTEADPQRRLIALLEASVGPYLETCLEDEGRLYARFCVQLTSDPRFDVVEMIGEAGNESLAVLQIALLDCIEGVERDWLHLRLRHGFSISLIQAAEYCRLLELGKAPPIAAAVREAAISLAGYMAAQAPVD